MATLPIPGLLAEFKILGLQAMDFGAQLSHFRARVLHWGDQLREEMTGKTDLCQLVDHDQLGLAEIAPEGKGLVLFHPEQKTQKARDGQRFTTGGASKEDFDVAQSKMETAKAALQEARSQVIEAASAIEVAIAEVDRLRVDIEDCSLVAPVRGRIQYRLAEPL